jgi:hypothetical protein
MTSPLTPCGRHRGVPCRRGGRDLRPQHRVDQRGDLVRNQWIEPSAVRLIALAERLRVLREFQPTMSAAPGPAAAENAAGAACADAVSVYAALGRDELREAVRSVVSLLRVAVEQ